MSPETLAVKLKNRPMLTLALLTLIGFCLLVITGLFVPQALALIEAINTHGVSGMQWTHIAIVIIATLYGVIGFSFYLAFKVLEKVVVDDILSSPFKPRRVSVFRD